MDDGTVRTSAPSKRHPGLESHTSKNSTLFSNNTIYGLIDLIQSFEDDRNDSGNYSLVYASENSTDDQHDPNTYYFHKTGTLVFSWILFAMIVIGNITVLTALGLSKSKKSRMNFFIMHLAIADLSVGLVSVFTDILWRTIIGFHGGVVLCKLVKFLQVIVTFSSTYVLVALSIDRYDAIRHPMNFTGGRTRAKILVLSAWLLSAIFSSPMLVLYDLKEVTGITQCWIELGGEFEWKVYFLLIAVSLFFIPTIIISGCYTIIVYTIWSKSKELTPRSLKQGGKKENKRFSLKNDVVFDKYSKRASSRGIIPRAKIKTVKLTLVIVLVFVLCWSPYFLYDIIQVFGHIPRTKVNNAISTFVQSLAPLNSAANPLIYCLFSTHICHNIRKFKFIDWILKRFTYCNNFLEQPVDNATNLNKSYSTSMTATTQFVNRPNLQAHRIPTIYERSSAI